MKNPIIIFCLLAAIGLVINTGCTSQPKLTKEQAEQKITELQTKLALINDQWYDIYEVGLVDSAGVAAKKVEEAQSELTSGELANASELLIRADTLLNQYSKTNLPIFSPETPLKNPGDPGKIRKADLADIEQLEMAGIPRWNYWFNFSGKGDDGKQYAAYACVNYHGTGALVQGVMFVLSMEDNGTKLMDGSLKVIPTRNQEKDRLVFTAKEGNKSLVYSIYKEKVIIDYKSPEYSVNLELSTLYSFWYNKGIQPVNVLPNTPSAGFEQPGPAKGTIVMGGKTIRVTGGGELENYFCGGKGGADYRTSLIKYGNEWWVPFSTDQISGIFVVTGPYKDAGLYVNGKYVIPSEFKILQGEPNKTFTISAKTSEGDLEITCNLWGMNPKLYECWGTVVGTFKGQELTNGNCWLEHVPQGGANESADRTPRKVKPANH
jgi:hypothetical protein